MGLIKGENISLYINGELMSCWRSSQIDITADTIGKSTIGSGNWKEFVGVALSWTASGEGQIYNDVNFSIHDAYDLMITLQTVFIVFTIEDKDAAGSVLNTMYYFGDAIITNINKTGSVNNIASYNISFQGTSELTRSDESDAIIYGNYPENFEITGTTPDTPGAGETTIDFAWDAADPEPDAYRIEVYDVTADVTTYWDGGGNTMQIFLGDTHSYTFKIRSVYFDYTAFSEYSPVIISWP